MTKSATTKHSTDPLLDSLKGRIDSGSELTVVKAPPGAGKTTLLVRLVEYACSKGLRVAIATQTNSQADEVCSRIHSLAPDVLLIHFVKSGGDDSSGGYVATSDQGDLPTKPCAIVATAAKLGMVELRDQFDFLFVEESWQLKMANFIPLCQVAEKFVFIGDPGQISPVVTLDTARWATAKCAPHLAAPSILLGQSMLPTGESPFTMPLTRRLPYDTAKMVRNFYDFDFGSSSQPGERQLILNKKLPSRWSAFGDALTNGSVCGMTIGTDKHGPPLDSDRALALLASDTIQALLDCKAETRIGDKVERLSGAEIGIVSTHRTMVQELALALPAPLRGHIMVDTPERWQGLERNVMLAVHPLSGVTRPSSFDLDTGRLCVMASRHKTNLIVLSRDHVPSMVDDYDPSADQPLGYEDFTGRGHAANNAFLQALVREKRWLKVS